MSTESIMPLNYLILCHTLLLLPSIFLSISVFSSESSLHSRCPKYWSFSFGISPSNEHWGLISFLYWLVGSPCSPRNSQESSPTPQFKSINSSVLSFLYSPTLMSIHDYWKNHSFDYVALVSRIMSLLLNTLSRLVIAFLPRSKYLLILWLQSLSTVTLEPKNIKFFTVSIEWWDWMPWSLFFGSWVLSQLFSLSSFTFIRRLFNSSSLSALRMISSAYLRLFVFLLSVFILAMLHPNISHDILCTQVK